MALIKCSNCGNSVSNKASKCPHCGTQFVVKVADYGEEENINALRGLSFLITFLFILCALIIFVAAFIIEDFALLFIIDSIAVGMTGYCIGMLMINKALSLKNLCEIRKLLQEKK